MTTFPQDFAWGTATASYQVEGASSADGKGPSIWDTFAHTPGTIADGETGDIAVDHYHRYAEDIAIMADLGLNAYRFSIAWPRIMPDGTGAPLAAGLDFYRRMAETCAEQGITPYATLYHWDLPQALEDQGGWLSRDTAHRFADYAAIVHERLSDVIGHWITVNEPWCSAFLGYASGVHAPGRSVGTRSLQAAHHLLLGHGEAVRAMRSGSAATSIGVTVNLYSIRAATDAPADQDAARRVDGLQNRLFLDPLLRGSYPADVLADTGTEEWFAERTEDLPVIKSSLDFVGVNYYSRHTVAAPGEGSIHDPDASSASPGSERAQMVDTGVSRTQMGWEIHPDGLVDVLEMITERSHVPVYVTENGSAYPDTVTTDGQVHDEDRQRYLELHLEACRQALSRGVPLRGYFAWSSMDNFEWAYGFTRRFGLVYVDFTDQRRIVKDSARWFRDFIAAERRRG